MIKNSIFITILIILLLSSISYSIEDYSQYKILLLEKNDFFLIVIPGLSTENKKILNDIGLKMFSSMYDYISQQFPIKEIKIIIEDYSTGKKKQLIVEKEYSNAVEDLNRSKIYLSIYGLIKQQIRDPKATFLILSSRLVDSATDNTLKKIKIPQEQLCSSIKQFLLEYKTTKTASTDILLKCFNQENIYHLKYTPLIRP